MSITIKYGSTTILDAYTWTDITPWTSAPDVVYVRTYSGGSMHYNGRELPTCTVRGYAPRSASAINALGTISGREVTVTASDWGMSGTARVVGVSAEASTAAHVFVTLTLRRTAL